jgi:hypothetical protein
MTVVVGHTLKNSSAVAVNSWKNMTVVVENNQSVRVRYNSVTNSSVANNLKSNFVVVENNLKNTKLVLVDYNRRNRTVLAEHKFVVEGHNQSVVCHSLAVMRHTLDSVVGNYLIRVYIVVIHILFDQNNCFVVDYIHFPDYSLECRMNACLWLLWALPNHSLLSPLLDPHLLTLQL